MKKYLIFFLLLVLLPVLHAQSTAVDPLYEQAKTHLINLLNIDTSQPEPDETAAVRYIYKQLNKHHIDWDFLSPRKGRANLVARIYGTDPKAKPLLLISHLDTAPAGENWTFPPYKATLFDGKIYGLGATDAKNYTAMHLALFTAIKDSGRAPKRDIILLVTSGEESGSDTGLKWLGQTYWDKIAPGFALNEGGGIIKNTPQNLPLVFAEAGTKMYMDLKITASGDAAHSSMPVEHNAVYRLSQVMAKLNDFNPPARLTENNQAFFSGILPLQEEDAQTTIQLLLSGKPEQKQMAAEIIAQDPFFRTQLKDTLNPVNISSGTDTGAAVAEASAIVNARLLPGTDPDQFLQELKKFLGNEDGISIEILERPQLPFPKPANGKDELFTAISHAATQMWPGAATVPGMSPASGDSEFLRRLGVITYGLGPA
ncbi:MAG: M20/M25/M40 family metallo-hydrolase, partial [Elusimicrobiaceae bacterium]|nr:M20/M25/M40 family metallo-hydrolase [Elusimicrobiaceae bacterium]